MGTQSLDVSQYVPTPAPEVGDIVQVVGVNPTVTAWRTGSAQGPTGPQGPPGPQGPIGPEGPQGDAGPAGVDGDDGPQGPQGSQGDQGAPGSDGADGVQGPMGPQGDQGAPGVIGTLVGQYTTPSGPLPPDGLLPVGFDTTTGNPTAPYQMQDGQGLLNTVNGHVMVFVGTGTDPTGWVDGGFIQGPPGPEGAQGVQGSPGIPGPQGIMGPRGPQGTAGAQGIPGPAGVQGSSGAQGPAGSVGPGGPAGPQGAQGPPGPVEEAPLDGQQYARENGGWLPTAIRLDAPSDGEIYGRQDADWVVVQQPLASDYPPLMDGVEDPGVEAAWSRGDHVHPSDTSLMPKSGGIFTGNVAFDAIAFFDAPANLDIGGGAKGDVLSTDGTGALSWTTGGGVTIGAAPTQPFAGQLWWDSVSGQLFVWFVDINSAQWVIATNTGGEGPQGAMGPPGPAGAQGPAGPQGPDSGAGVYVPLAGGIMTGTLSAPAIDAPQAIGDNRIINGDCRIDQRHNGAAGTTNGYWIDRWFASQSQTSKLTWQRVAGPVALGFPYCFQFTSSSAYASVAADVFTVYQPIEADMVSDFAWGTAGAQPVTLSFLASSSIAGTFGGTVKNYASAAPYRTYPFSFSLPTANTWTWISITIPGDTAAGWTMSGNSGGVYVQFDLGSGSTYRAPAGAWIASNYIGATGTVSLVGTNGAYFAFTGVKLEIGTIATPYNRETMAKVLTDCQRYFESGYPVGINPGSASASPAFFQYQSGLVSQVNYSGNYVPFKTTKRTTPTLTLYSPRSGAAGVIADSNQASLDIAATAGAVSSTGVMVYATQTVAQPAINYQGQWAAAAEL